MRGHRRDPQTGPGQHVGARRQAHGVGTREHHPLSGRATSAAQLGFVEPHRLAHACRGHPSAHRFDDPRPVLMGNDPGIRHGRDGRTPRRFTSEGLMPEVCTRTQTSPGPTGGCSMSASCRTPAPRRDARNKPLAYRLSCVVLPRPPGLVWAPSVLHTLGSSAAPPLPWRDNRGRSMAHIVSRARSWRRRGVFPRWSRAHRLQRRADLRGLLVSIATLRPSTHRHTWSEGSHRAGLTGYVATGRSSSVSTRRGGSEGGQTGPQHPFCWCGVKTADYGKHQLNES